MDFVFRCNSTECRIPLRDVAAVTTCSHIFCSSCSNSFGLSNRIASERFCPACDSHLENPRDVVITNLKPTEDYKSSILSGLTPSIIMECAGRALHFYAYQVSQEIVYQEYFGKSIADKYSALSSHLDKIITDANSEVLDLRSKLSTFEQDKKVLYSKLTTLHSDYDNKCRAFHKLQKEYDVLKGRSSVSDSKTAAASAVERSIGLQGLQHPDRHINTPISLDIANPANKTAQYRVTADAHQSDWNGAPEGLYRQSSCLGMMHYPESTRSHVSPRPSLSQSVRFRNPDTRMYRAGRSSIPENFQHGRLGPAETSPVLHHASEACSFCHRDVCPR